MTRWLFAAIAAHLALFLVLTFWAPKAVQSRRPVPPPVLEISISTLPEREAPAASPSRAATAPPQTTSPASAPAVPKAPRPKAPPIAKAPVRGAKDGSAEDARPTAQDKAPSPALSGGLPGGDSPRGRSGDIQIFPSTLDALAMAREQRGPPGPRRAPSKFQQNLEQEHFQATARSGVGPQGAIATALRDATRELAPREAEARIVTLINGAGRVVDVQVQGGRGANWRAVAALLKKALEDRALPVMGAKRGVRVVSRVVVALRLPSGASESVDFRGTSAGFDVADIGASKRRVISVSTVRVAPL